MEPSESLNLRVPPGLKRQAGEYARQSGICVNAGRRKKLAGESCS